MTGHGVRILPLLAVPPSTDVGGCGTVPPLLASVPRNADGPRQIHRFPCLRVSDFCVCGPCEPMNAQKPGGEVGRVRNSTETLSKTWKLGTSGQILSGMYNFSSMNYVAFRTSMQNCSHQRDNWCRKLLMATIVLSQAPLRGVV